MEDIQFKKNYSAMIGTNYPVTQPKSVLKSTGNAEQQNEDFSKLFQAQLQKDTQLTFSKHAIQRMNSRNIEISPQMLTKISGAVKKAKAKGIQEALILSGQTAFIVNVPSSTVVTTMNGQEMTDSVFTNIDGAVIV